MTAPAVRLDGLMQIAINVKDVDRATAFYRDTLGLRFLFSAPGLAFFDAGGVRLMLVKAERPELDHPSSILYFRAADIEEAHRGLAGRGVVLLTKPHVVHRAEAYDGKSGVGFLDGASHGIEDEARIAVGAEDVRHAAKRSRHHQ